MLFLTREGFRLEDLTSRYPWEQVILLYRASWENHRDRLLDQVRALSVAVSDALANSFGKAEGKVLKAWEKSLRRDQNSPQKYMSDEAFDFFKNMLPVKGK